MAEHEEEHVVSPLIYLAVLIALMLLLALTLVAAFVDLDKIMAGRNHQGTAYWNMTVAVLIAMLKATLIILFFMHVKYQPRVNWAFVMAGFVWLGILMTLSLADYMSRNYPPGAPKSAPFAPSPDFMRPPQRPPTNVPRASAEPAGPLISPGHSFWRHTDT
ncbi:MAG TPA: cytochrome C oxidase subunit IV family protein [Tepidisphaeraceae bacterium]|nr:cytochrome C oxidase subunit IV family protein [Tepidisphaeraceae bacterium]